jgi:hypothetical protein
MGSFGTGERQADAAMTETPIGSPKLAASAVWGTPWSFARRNGRVGFSFVVYTISKNA